MMYQQGLPLLSGKLSLRGMYNHSNTRMFQDGIISPARYNVLGTKASLYLSPCSGCSIDYALQYVYDDMRPASGSRIAFNNWQHTAKVVVPAGWLRLTVKGEYDHNQLTPSKYKDAFFADAVVALTTRHIDYELGRSKHNMYKKSVATCSWYKPFQLSFVPRHLGILRDKAPSRHHDAAGLRCL